MIDTIYRLQRLTREADNKGDKYSATTARRAVALILKLRDDRDAARFGVTRYWSDEVKSAEYIASGLITERRVLRNQRTGVYATCPMVEKMPSGWELIGTYSPGATAKDILEDMSA